MPLVRPLPDLGEPALGPCVGYLPQSFRNWLL